MSNLLKFLLAVSLLICVFFSIALIFGCDENVENNQSIPVCSENHIYNDIIKQCVIPWCTGKYYIKNDEVVEMTGIRGCYQGCLIKPSKTFYCNYGLNPEEITYLEQFDPQD